MNQKILFFFASLILLFPLENTTIAKPRNCQQLSAQLFGITTESATSAELPALFFNFSGFENGRADQPTDYKFLD